MVGAVGSGSSGNGSGTLSLPTRARRCRSTWSSCGRIYERSAPGSGVASDGVRCSCGSALQRFWIWPDEERDDLMHVTDRIRDVPKHADEVRAVSATDAAIAYDRK